MAAGDPLRYVDSASPINLQLVIDLTAAAHMCTADDDYDGYFIPKGTIVLGNTWSAPS